MTSPLREHGVKPDIVIKGLKSTGDTPIQKCLCVLPTYVRTR